MVWQIDNKKIKSLLIGSIFILYFLYFAVINRYHLHYLEQSQLFPWTFNFLKEQLSLPGGFTDYLGSFFTQFFFFSWAGAIIHSILAFGVFRLILYILKKHNLNNVVLPLISVCFLAILNSSELFTFNQNIGLLLSLSFFAFYVSLNKTGTRYLFFFAGWPLLYILAGGFSIPVVLMSLLHEVLFRKDRSRFIISVLYIAVCILIPLLASRTLYYIQPNRIFTYPLITTLPSVYKYSLILVLIWTPLTLLISFFLRKNELLMNKLVLWTPVNSIAGVILIVLMSFIVYRYAYNQKAEMMFGIDYHVQNEEWKKVLRISDKYPGNNTLVIYYTNLALYKTDQLLDKLFSYPQYGSHGLRLRWARNLNLFFGGEVFYQLSYNNESIHWAFEALVAKGLNPRSLKRLASGFIVNGNYKVSEKYINILKHTLFYRAWALKHESYIKDPGLIRNDPQLAKSIDLRVKNNFFSEVDGMNLPDLLSNHPDNKMAYEYLVASLLLDKNLDGFIQVLPGLTDFGYKKLPVHVEEALIFYNFYEGKQVLPEGFTFNPQTITRFNEYAMTYSKFRSDRAAAAFQLKKKHEKTFWYYLQFINS